MRSLFPTLRPLSCWLSMLIRFLITLPPQALGGQLRTINGSQHSSHKCWCTPCPPHSLQTRCLQPRAPWWQLVSCRKLDATRIYFTYISLLDAVVRALCMDVFITGKLWSCVFLWTSTDQEGQCNIMRKECVALQQALLFLLST